MQRKFLDKHLTECRERIVQCTLCEKEFAFWRLKVIACRDDVLENYNMNFVEAFSFMPTPRVAISFFSCFNPSHTDFVIFKNNLHSTSLQKLLTALICRSQYYCTGGALIRQGRASIRLFTIFCRRGCISIASQTVDKGVNCVTIIICSKKISAQNMTWQLRALTKCVVFWRNE